MVFLEIILETPVEKANLSVLLLNNCKAVSAVNVGQLLRLYLEKDEKLLSICGRRTRNEIENFMKKYNISKEDYEVIKKNTI